MKHTKTIIAFLLVLLALTACHKDKEFDVKDAVVSNEEIMVLGTQARFSWKVDFEGHFQTGVEVSQNENMVEARRVDAAKEEDRFVAVVDSLPMGTKYYYRIVVWNKFGDFGQPVGNFTTSMSYTILVSAEPSDGGAATGGGTYAAGDTCTVMATAHVGYNFVNWTENGSQVSTEAEYSFAVTGDRNLVAHFTSQECTITAIAEPSEGGTVDGSGGYNHGDECTLTATANEGYTFINWTKDGTEISTNPVFTFTVTETATYVAHFQVQSYTIMVASHPENGGTVEGGGTYEYGQTCTVKATEANGYHFVNWTENGGQVSSNTEYTFTVTGNRDLVANFTSQDYIIQVDIDPENGGTVTGAGGYNYGDQCTLTATPANGYSFVKWTENGEQVSGNATYTFTVTGSRNLVAHFQAEVYTITVSAEPSAGGTVYGGGDFHYGEPCTVTAIAETGYTFANWTENGNIVSTQANYTFTVNGNRTLVAHFTQTHTITVSANPPEGGTVAGGGTYSHGESCMVIATAADGYTFTNWTENGNVVSTDANYTFTVNSNCILEANFSALPPDAYNINVSANPSNGGTVTGGGSYNQGASCIVTATANVGYTFIQWTENGNPVSTNANYMFTVTGDRTLIAQFQAQSHTINVSTNPTTGGSASGGGTYNYGQSCTVNATPASGYSFVQWTENGNIVSTNASYTFTVTDNRDLVANFVQNHTINVSSQPVYGGMVLGGGTYYHGQSCTVTATSATGFLFVNWLENGNVVSTSSNYTFTVTNNRNLVAGFGHTVTVSSSPSGGGTTTGGGVYYHGQSCTVTATANSGYFFANWTENGNVVSTNTDYQFDVNSNKSLMANFIQAPTGAIVGLFSVSETQRIWFSQGNLQYQASSNTWRFAENQWDFVGNATYGTVYENEVKCNNALISPTYDGWIDLFGWGTSGYNHGAFSYQPWSISGNNSEYYAYGYWQYNLFDQTGQADWGYNAISNGGNTINTWHTLSKDEWIYIINTRDTESGIRWAKGTVNGVNGTILLPDNWIASIYELYSPNGGDYSSNIITLLEWDILEQHGAVFLPNCGYRLGTQINGTDYYYWSASSKDSNQVYSIMFTPSNIHEHGDGRNYGQGVRLVHSFQ